MGTDRHRLTLIGDVGVDFVLGPVSGWPRIGTETLVERSELRAGGSAGNAALAASYLGCASRLVSAVGNDDFGVWLGDQFRGLGASLHVCDTATTVTVALIDASGERTFLTTHGHLETLSYELIRPQLVPAPDRNSVVLLSGVFLTPALRATYPLLIRDLLALGYQVALDTNWPPAGWTAAVRAEVAAWISHCDHVLLNELEVRSLADSADLTVAIDRLTPVLKAGATLVVKAGPRGAIAVQHGRRFECAAPDAEVYDTIGAGDSFNAGYLLARLRGADLEKALLGGCSTAASIISRFPRRRIRPSDLAGHLQGLRPCAATPA
jgi:ribokinase